MIRKLFCGWGNQAYHNSISDKTKNVKQVEVPMIELGHGSLEYKFRLLQKLQIVTSE